MCLVSVNLVCSLDIHCITLGSFAGAILSSFHIQDVGSFFALLVLFFFHHHPISRLRLPLSMYFTPHPLQSVPVPHGPGLQVVDSSVPQ